MTEYTLVFRRIGGRRRDFSRPYNGWTLARPGLASLMLDTTPGIDADAVNGRQSGEIAQVVVVPLCSTLALEPLAYEHFLMASGVLPHTLRLLAHVRLTDAHAVEMVRRRIQSLVMAAEVQAIIEGLSA